MGPRLTAAERTWLDEPAGHPVYAGGAAELERRRRATPTMRAASAGSSPENGRRSRRPTSETPSSSYGSPACHGARTSSAGTRSPGVSRSASREVVHAGGGASEAAAGGGGGGVRGIARRHSKETARHSEHGDAPQGKDTPWCVRVGGVGGVGGEGGVWGRRGRRGRRGCMERMPHQASEEPRFVYWCMCWYTGCSTLAYCAAYYYTA